MGKCIKCGTNFVGAPENPPADALCKYCEIDQLKAAIEDIRQVATGERQVGCDDTEGMEWIVRRIAEIHEKRNNPMSAEKVESRDGK